MAHKKSGSVPSRFKPGDNVRVRHGVNDPDFPDIPLGGWAGTVKEVEEGEPPTTVLVAWDRGPSAACTGSTRSDASGMGSNWSRCGWVTRTSNLTMAPRRHRAADVDRHQAAVGEGPGRSGPHGPRADPRRPAPRREPEDLDPKECDLDEEGLLCEARSRHPGSCRNSHFARLGKGGRSSDSWNGSGR